MHKVPQNLSLKPTRNTIFFIRLWAPILIASHLLISGFGSSLLIKLVTEVRKPGFWKMEALESNHFRLKLFHLSGECIGLIISKLLWKDLNALFSTGNHLIQAQIYRYTTQIEAQLYSLQVYPIQAFEYPHLKSLTATSTKRKISGDTEYDPYYVINDQLCKPHNSLESLEIQGSLAFLILNANHQLSVMLPGLKKLKLASNGCLTGDDFLNLPPKLTYLSLRSKWHSTSEPASNLPLSTIKHLPQTLETLKISRIYLSAHDDSLENVSFPPGLTNLRCHLPDARMVYEMLPHTLRALRLDLSGLVIWKSSNISRLTSLTSLAISCTLAFMSFRLMIDVPFSSSLTSLTLPVEPSYCAFQGRKCENLNELLPRSLTSFNGLTALHASTDWATTAPLLKHASLAPNVLQGSSIPSKLPPLVSLSISTPLLSDHIDTILPNTLTELHAPVQKTSSWLKAITQLTQLKTLDLAESSSQMPSQGFWRFLKPRLTSLSVYLDHFEAIEDLEDDWTFLKALKLTWEFNTLPASPLKNALDIRIASTPLQPVRFPLSLTSLQLYPGSHHRLFFHPIDCLTQLDTLEVNITTDVSSDPAGYFCFFTTLPSSLTRLWVTTNCKLPELFLKALPPGLRYLRARSRGNDTDEPWSNELLACLPRTLVFLRDEARLNGTTANGVKRSVVDEAFETAHFLPPALLAYIRDLEILELRTEAAIESTRQLTIRCKKIEEDEVDFNDF